MTPPPSAPQVAGQSGRVSIGRALSGIPTDGECAGNEVCALVTVIICGCRLLHSVSE